MGTCLYAAYGSNLHPLRLGQRIPGARLVGQGYLDGWYMRYHKKSDVDGSGKCSIFPGAGGVHFAVYEMALADKPILDAIEGVGVGYEDVSISLPGFEDCQTYVARQEVIDSGLVPMDWYRDLVLAGCLYHRFPEQYINEVAATPAITDPDAVRRRANQDLVRQLRDGDRT